MTLARPTGGGPAPVLRPGVTFETKCYERDWRELLLTDRLSRAIELHRFPFAERILYINNVERPELVLRHARRLVDEGVLTDCVLVDEHSEEALRFFGLTEEGFQGGYRYSIAELVAIYRCRTDYLLHYAGDCMLEEPTDWLRPCLDRMRLQPSVVAANPVPNGRADEAAREALLTDGDFHLGYGFSDQCYLVRTLDFRARIYGESHPASERYPSYGGELFEKRVDAWMRRSGLMRLTWSKGSYWHRTLRRSDPELDPEAPAQACYRTGVQAMEKLDYENASIWLSLAELARSAEQRQGRTADAALSWLPRLQLAVCADRLGRTAQAWRSNEAAAVYAPPGQSSIAFNRSYLKQRLEEERPGAAGEQESAEPLLSVLIPSLPERIFLLAPLLEELHGQALGRPVELLVLTDNRRRSTGEKRNALLGQARGRFAAFVDDDDRVDERYVEQLLRAIRLAPEADCIVFDVIVHGPDSPARLCRYGTELEHGMDGEVYTRKPNHLMAYRRELALRHRYRDIGYGEDDEWAARASADIRIQHRIEAALYEYDWVPKPPSWYGSGRSEA